MQPDHIIIRIYLPWETNPTNFISNVKLCLSFLHYTLFGLVIKEGTEESVFNDLLFGLQGKRGEVRITLLLCPYLLVYRLYIFINTY